MRAALRACELVLLFVALPGVLAWLVPVDLMARVLFPVLLSAAALCLTVLLTDPTFDRGQLWRARAVRSGLRNVLLRFLVIGPLVVLMVWLTWPQRLLAFPLERPAIWLIVMGFYPLLSVMPQEIIFRVFMFHRYEQLCARRVSRGTSESSAAERRATPGVNWPIILVSALAFGWIHILFRTPLGIVLTAGAGFFFALDYHRHRSLALAWVDHALWGCFAFTIGLGHLFFLGGIARQVGAG